LVQEPRPAFISVLSLSTISPDVSLSAFLGAPMPCHVPASKPGTDSATVGTCGNARKRVSPFDQRECARPAGLFLQERISLLDQPLKLFALLRNPVRISILILGARECSRLLDKLPDVLANDGDVLFELSERRRTAVAHHVSPGVTL
jgi:hypothetical protein